MQNKRVEEQINKAETWRTTLSLPCTFIASSVTAFYLSRARLTLTATRLVWTHKVVVRAPSNTR
jgi:hypothetical protein